MKVLPLVLWILIGCLGCRQTDAVSNETSSSKTMDNSLPIGIVYLQGESENWLPFKVEIATNHTDQARGLMFREELLEDEGMLFVFPREAIRSFWMKNTLIPLDIIFLDEKGIIVGIVHEAEPLTLDSRSVGRPSRYVVEIPGGTAKIKGIKEGHRARFLGPPKVAKAFGLWGLP